MRFPLILLLVVPLAACGSRELNVPIPATYSAIHSLSIAPKCLQCHQSLATYQGMMAVVTPGDPEHSRIYEQLSSGEMPYQSPKLSDAELNAIYAWIKNGAPND